MPKSNTPPAPRHLAKTVTSLLPSRLSRRWASGKNTHFGAEPSGLLARVPTLRLPRYRDRRQARCPPA